MCIDFGISRSDFRSRYQEQKPLLIRHAVATDAFTWKDVNELFERSDVADSSFKLAYDGIRPKHEYVERYVDIGTPRHRLIKPVVYEYMRKGATLIANRIKHEPKVSQFARAVGEFTGRQVVSSAYAAFGGRSSFRCHWDTRDVFAIQLIGRKRWVVYAPSFDAPLHTQQSKDYEHLYPCPKEASMDFVLEPGDVFYLPRGWWHDPLPLEEGSFHLALGTFPAYTVDYLEWVMRQMRGQADARQSLSHWDSDKDRLAGIGRQLDAFVNDPGNYERFMDQFHAAKRDESPLALEHFGDPRAGIIDDQTGLRVCAHAAHGLEEDYLVRNGRRIQIDRQIADLIRHISGNPGVRLRDVLAQSPVQDKEMLTQLIVEFCRQDVLCLCDGS